MFIHIEKELKENYRCELFDIATGLGYKLTVPNGIGKVKLVVNVPGLGLYYGQEAISFWMQLVASADAPFAKNMTAVKKIEEWIERNKG